MLRVFSKLLTVFMFSSFRATNSASHKGEMNEKDEGIETKHWKGASGGPRGRLTFILRGELLVQLALLPAESLHVFGQGCVGFLQLGTEITGNRSIKAGSIYPET